MNLGIWVMGILFVSFLVWFFIVPNTYNEVSTLLLWTESLLEIFEKYFWRNYNSFLCGRIKWQKLRNACLGNPRIHHLSSIFYFLFFKYINSIPLGFCSTKQVKRHLTGFSFVITDVINNTKIEAIFASKLQFHIKPKTNNAAFAEIYHPSHISKGG